MTDDELAAIEARADAASAGPWMIAVFCAADTEEGDAMTAITFHDADGPILAQVNRWSYGDDPPKLESDANAAFIAHSRLDVPALLAEVRRLRARVAAMEDQDRERESVRWGNLGEDV